MSETTLTKDEIQAIRNRELVTVCMTRELGSEDKTVVITPEERRALCDAADRAETLAYENHLLRRGHDDDRAEVDRLQAQLTEVTRERDEARDEHAAESARAARELKDLEAALAPLRAVVGEASIVACDACGRELGSAPTIPPCPECIGFKRAKAHALPADPSASTLR